MALTKWTLLHIRSPLNTVSGTGQYGELTKATSRKLTFSMVTADTLSFNLPGNHPQTARITPLVDDVLAFRGNPSDPTKDTPVQRFRVVSRVLDNSSGVTQASFSAVSYRALLDAWLLHDSDKRSWPVPIEQSLMAWNILNEGQTKANGNLGVTRGVVPVRAVNRTLLGSVAEGGTRPEYFLAGMKRSEAIDNISAMIDGFEWDIEPDISDPYRSLKFNCWNVGGRSAHATRSDMVLDVGGTVLTWSHSTTPSDYGNVVRVTGAETTQADSSTPVAILPSWQPSENPALPVPEGRWERDLNNSDLTTQKAVNDSAPGVYADAHQYLPEITSVLRRGKWQGPAQLWIGDYARLIITEPVVDLSGRGLTDPNQASYVLYVDEDVRVVELNVDVDDVAGEDVTLSLNRPRFDTRVTDRLLNDRLDRLERRS